MLACLDWLLSALQLPPTHQEDRQETNNRTQKYPLANDGAVCKDY